MTHTTTIPEAFKAYIYTRHDATEDQLKLRADVRQTSLGASQVRIRVHSAALNPVDRKVLEHGVGFIPAVPTEDAPFRIGFDAAGTVVELGSDVSKDDNDGKGFHVCNVVYAMLPFTSFGAVGEFVDVDAQFVAPKPANLDFDQAASIPLAALTSCQALATVAKVQPDERVLILDGSGGTGVFAVQIAKALGAHVTTTTSFRNAAFVQALGADRVVDYTKHKWVDVLDAYSIDVLYDCGVERRRAARAQARQLGPLRHDPDAGQARRVAHRRTLHANARAAVGSGSARHHELD